MLTAKAYFCPRPAGTSHREQGYPTNTHSSSFELLLGGRRGDGAPGRNNSLGLLTDTPEAEGQRRREKVSHLGFCPNLVLFWPTQ